MAIQTIAYLKSKFETGDKPTQQDFYDLLDTMFSLGGSSSFNPENITTDLKFANTTSNRILERRRLSGSILQYLSQIQFGDNDLRLIVEDWATGGVLKDYASYQVIGGTFHNWIVGNVPSGVSNSMQLLIDRLNLNKPARYSSALSLVNDLDLVYKKWVEDNFPKLVSGLIPTVFLPSYVDDVLEFANLAAFPVTGESGKIYISIDTNFQYRWSGSAYVQITSASAVWGAISGSLASQTDLQAALNARLLVTDIINILTDASTNKALSAAQGKALNDNKLDKLLLQSSPPTASAHTVDGVKFFADANSNLGLVKRDGNNQIITTEAQMLTLIGDIINDYFDRPATGFALTGANISQSIVANKWRIANATGNTTWLHFAEIGYITWLWQYDFSIKITNVSNGNGVGIGFKQASGGGNGIRVDLSAGANRGKLYLVTFSNSGVETILQTSTPISFTNTTDELYLCLRRDGYMLYGELVNITTSGEVVILSQLSSLSSNAIEAFGIHSNLIVGSFGGTQDISNLNLKSSQKRKHKLAIVGDSNSIGRNSAAAFDKVYSQAFGNSVHGETVIYSAAGAKLTDFEANIQEFLKYIDVDEVFLALGTNDSGASLSPSSFLSSFSNVITILINKGCKVIVALIPPTSNSTRNTTYIVPYNTGILAESTRVEVVDFHTLMKDGSGLLAAQYDRDGVHFNELAHVAATSLLSTQLKRFRRITTTPADGSLTYAQFNTVETRGMIVSNTTVQTALNTESGWTLGVKTGISNLLAGQFWQGQNLTDTNKRYGYFCPADGTAYRWLITEAIAIETTGLVRPYALKSANYSFTANDENIEFDASANAILAPPSLVSGQKFCIMTGATSVTVTLIGTINGSTSNSITGSYQKINLLSTGVEYRII